MSAPGRPKRELLPPGGKARSAKGAPITAWQRLDRELDAWRESERPATLWWRDDDACRDSPRMQRLLGIARAAQVPVTLAAIPATSERSLVDAVSRSGIATVVQHGYAHRNHAPSGARNRELGTDRSVAVTLAELEQGRTALGEKFGAHFAAVLVPPWNRIAPEIVAGLSVAGFHGLSTFGPRVAAHPVPGILQCNTHVDLVAWRTGRTFVGVDAAVEGLVGHLEARREGRVDPLEPSGLLTHHLALDAAGWQFLADLVVRTREHGAVTWLAACDAFGAAAPPLISSRSA